MAKVLLDTDILSEIIKGKDVTIFHRARSYLEQHDYITISAISVMEVIAGFSKRNDEVRAKKFLELVRDSEVLPLDTIAAELAGRISADLQRMGRDIGVPDTMIAAIAMHRGLPLITGNTSDYARVQGAGYPLVLENWRIA